MTINQSSLIRQGWAERLYAINLSRPARNNAEMRSLRVQLAVSKPPNEGKLLKGITSNLQPVRLRVGCPFRSNGWVW